MTASRPAVRRNSIPQVPIVVLSVASHEVVNLALSSPGAPSTSVCSVIPKLGSEYFHQVSVPIENRVPSGRW
jgi:hypothetical protein